MNWRDRKLDSCAQCTLIDQPGPCWGSGSPERAKLIYIAQNPGRHEVAARPMEPLVGPSGHVFNRQLFQAGVRRSELFITNQVKCLTPDNREPTEAEVECCRPLLARELGRCRADTVVLAGAVAFRSNIGRYSTLSPDYSPTDSIFERMGCVEQRDARKWLGTIHPAFVMRAPDYRDAAIDHLRKAARIAGRAIPLPVVHTEPEGAIIERHRTAARRHRLFADDCETLELPDNEDDYVGGRHAMDICGFSAIPYEAFVVDRDRIAGAWGDIFIDANIWQAEHNGEYDRYHLEQLVPQRNTRFDTMQAHHWLHNNLPKYLKPVCVSVYTDLPYYDRHLEQLDRRLYCGLDNVSTYLCARQQIRLLKEAGLWELFWRYAMPLLPLLERQRRIGARVDTRRALLYKLFLEHQLDAGEARIRELVGDEFNPRSPKQRAELWYEQWGLPKQYIQKDKQKVLSTNEHSRERLKAWINQSPKRQKKFAEANELFNLIDSTTQRKKLCDYFNRVSPDERIHTHWKAHATTYRLKSTPSMQNWPASRICCHSSKCTCGLRLASLRSVIIPDDDESVLISTDFDQIELWVYAVQFDIKWLLDVYQRGDYIYGAVYESVLERQFFQEGKARTKRNMCESVNADELRLVKTIPLGFLYGRTGEAVAAQCGWTPATGRSFREQWFARVPELPRAHDAIRYEMEQRGVLRPPPGVMLHYPSPSLQGLNCYGQTPAAFVLIQSLIECERAFAAHPELGARVVLTVHDALLFNVKRQYVCEAYEEVIHPILTQPITWLKNFRFRHEAKVGSRWDWEMVDYDEWVRRNKSAA